LEFGLADSDWIQNENRLFESIFDNWNFKVQ